MNSSIERSGMYSCITILGLGSLGGYIADAVSELRTLKKVILVDYDRVEKKNLKNMIYELSDIDKLKTDALSEIVNSKNEEIEVIKLNEKFIEGKTKFPESDLVLDCRDFTYDRKSLIDARLFVSSRYLIIDCRKSVKYEKHYEGKYISQLTKGDLRYASSIVSNLIYNGTFKTLVNNKSVNKFELDYLKQVNHTNDIAYGHESGEERLVNLKESLFPILDINKKSDLNVNMCVGDRVVSVKTIPKGLLRSGNDVIVNLVSMINFPFVFTNYIIYVHGNSVVLIPETGAA